MKYIKKFEAVIMPPSLTKPTKNVTNLKSLKEYAKENGFVVMNYDEFFNSLNATDKKTAPPKHGMPFFGMFNAESKEAVFVLCDENAITRVPDFLNRVKDIIGHELIHKGQTSRAGEEKYVLPNPMDRKSYFANKEEIMAFSWTIANELAKDAKDVETAFMTSKSRLVQQLWGDIKRYSEEEVLKRYRKYIYMYLDKMLSKKIDNIHTKINNKK